jgi:hypothetical protein
MRRKVEDFKENVNTSFIFPRFLLFFPSSACCENSRRDTGALSLNDIFLRVFVPLWLKIIKKFERNSCHQIYSKKCVRCPVN